MNTESRLKKIQSDLVDFDCDALLIESAENRRYLSGFTGSFGFLVITKEKAFLLTDSRYQEQAKMETKGIEIVLLSRYTIEHSIAIICRENKVDVLGFERNRISYELYDGLAAYFGRPNLRPIQNLVEGYRAIKDDEEIALLREAERIGDEAFNNILPLIKPGVEEREIALELDYQMRKLGASGNSFDSIVASGYRGALPHGLASDKKIESGDLIVMDFGCVYKGYCSDMTRTVGVGAVGEKEREVYQAVLKTQLTCLEAIKAGVVGKDIHMLAEKVIADAGYGPYFGHGLGHAVGLEIHETPCFNRAEKKKIQAGTCITVEPGIYLPNQFGVRIEDMIVVTEEGYENLTHSSKDLLLL